jgi:creatinine amidohydrolase
MGTVIGLIEFLNAEDSTEGYYSQIASERQEFCVSYLRPKQIKQRIAESSIVFVPIGPLEWHGLHMPFGTDPLIAESVSLGVCQKTGGVVWPTIYWGAATLRSPEESMRIFGPELNQYTWSVDFPNNTLKSAYCSEEILALIMRETIKQISLLNPKLIVILSGHAAGGHVTTLERIALEETIKGGPKVHYRGAWAFEPKNPERIGGHACAGETSQMMYLTNAVNLKELPNLPNKLKYFETGIVDDWSGNTTYEYSVMEPADPRINSSVQYGELITQQAIEEIVDVVKKIITLIK